MQRLSRRRQDANPGTRPQQCIDEEGAGGQQVLAVVEDEEPRPLAQAVDERLHGRPSLLSEAQRGQDLPGEQAPIGQRGQLHEEDFIAVRLETPARRGRGQACLTHAARTGEGDQPRS
jgi:hypothetical protein